MFVVVLYHENCSDGKMAAYVAHKKLIFNGFPDNQIFLIPANYKNNKLSVEEYIHLLNRQINTQQHYASLKKIKNQVKFYVVDFSLPDDYISELLEYGDITVLDHHKTAYEQLCNNGFWEQDECSISGYTFYRAYKVTKQGIDRRCNFYFSDKDSGAKMAWRFFYTNDQVPDYVEYTSDRDMWTFKEKNTNNFHAGIGLIKHFTPKAYEKVLENVNKVISTGETVNEYRQVNIDKIANSKHKVISIKRTDVEYKAYILNCTAADILSDVGSELYKGEVGIVIMYSIMTDTTVLYSVRSKQEIDSSFIATCFGGGGHSSANGFRTPLDTLFHILKTEQLIIP